MDRGEGGTSRRRYERVGFDDAGTSQERVVSRRGATDERLQPVQVRGDLGKAHLYPARVAGDQRFQLHRLVHRRFPGEWPGRWEHLREHSDVGWWEECLLRGFLAWCGTAGDAENQMDAGQQPLV